MLNMQHRVLHPVHIDCESNYFQIYENLLTNKNFRHFFSSPGPKVHVSYCHHNASVVVVVVVVRRRRRRRRRRR